MRWKTCLVIALTCGLAPWPSGECIAMAEPVDDHSAVEIGIVRPHGSSGGDLVTTAAGLLHDRLVADRFPVVFFDGPAQNPRELLDDNPDLVHLITGLRAKDEDTVEAHLYTRGPYSAKRFEASVEDLAARVTAFLNSEQAVDMRLQLDSGDSDPYQRALEEGLRHLRVLEGSQGAEEEEAAQAAVAAFEEAARLRPEEADPHLNLALTYAQLGETERRRQHIGKGLTKDPLSWRLGNEEALLHIMDGDLEAAAARLGELPETPTVVWNLAYVYGRLDDMEKAKKYFERFTELETGGRQTLIAENRLEELEEKEQRLGAARKGLWIALGGLGGILAIAAIMLVARRLARRADESKELAPGDRLAVKVQVGLAVVSGLFSLLTVALSNLLSG